MCGTSCSSSRLIFSLAASTALSVAVWNTYTCGLIGRCAAPCNAWDPGDEFWCGLRCTRDHAAQTGSQTQRQYAAQGASGSTAQAPCLHVHQVCADLDVGEAPQEGGRQQQVLDSVGGVHIQRQSVAVGQACRGPKEVGEGPYCWVARAGARNCAGLVLPGYHGQRRRGRAGSSCWGTGANASRDSRHAHAGLTPCDQPTELASTACP